ncbi:MULTISPECIES: hypothetical protein [unclassified Chelatococcus]|nr:MULTISPECIES: hypothetical protein [unclassified Chelatococcus]MBS7738938.1 hypothetical protein [Chelatococcus sp. HY11]MBX3543371.1 hypothetical protein [Chelatococcus sp.]MCO5076533.1 hypothetical protein [Chelatococcus sp.]
MNRSLGRGDVDANLAPTFAKATAEAIGKSERTVQRHVTRSEIPRAETL